MVRFHVAAPRASESVIEERLSASVRPTVRTRVSASLIDDSESARVRVPDHVRLRESDTEPNDWAMVRVQVAAPLANESVMLERLSAIDRTSILTDVIASVIVETES